MSFSIQLPIQGSVRIDTTDPTIALNQIWTAEIIKKGLTLYSWSNNLHIDQEIIDKIVKDNDLKIVALFKNDVSEENTILTSFSVSYEPSSVTTMSFCSETLFVKISLISDKAISSIYIECVDEKRLDGLINLIKSHPKNKKKEEENHKKIAIKVLTQYGSSGYGTMDLLFPYSKFEPLNYPQEILPQFDHIIEDLQSKNPCGRLIILGGMPGVGKTSFLASLISMQLNVTPLLIQSTVFAELTLPNLIESLNNIRYSYDRSILLIVEDADILLMKRETDNLSAIEAMLNISDGIISKALDLRIICTTNQNQSIDDAVMRSGRLCTKIDIEPITKMDKVEIIMNNILKKTPSDLLDKAHKILQKEGFITLADIYKLAQFKSTNDKNSSIRHVGFKND